MFTFPASISSGNNIGFPGQVANFVARISFRNIQLKAIYRSTGVTKFVFSIGRSTGRPKHWNALYEFRIIEKSAGIPKKMRSN